MECLDKNKMNADLEDELLEVIDEQGRVIGIRSRAEIHNDPSLAHRAVHVFVMNKQGDLFFQKRSRTKRIQPGKWDTSVGGHVNPGESYEAAAAREFEEELGVKMADLGNGARMELLHSYVWHSPVETEHVKTYRIIYEGPFTLHPAEIEDGRFWAPDEIRAAVRTGVLTPNLEEELRRLRIID